MKLKLLYCRGRILDYFPLIGVIIGILILRPLEGGDLRIRGLHYTDTFSGKKQNRVGLQQYKP